jgi:tetratricopeptide (TPR) repeat protein
VLGSGSAAHVVRELSTGLAEIVLSAQASVAARMARLAEVLAGPRKLAGLNREMRTQLQLGAVYLRGVSEVYAGNPVVLELAAQLDASGSAFSKPRAALLRMCHFGFRGEQDAADSEGGRAEVLALLGGTSWSAMSAMAIRRLLVFQWTRDSVGLLRVVNELQDLTAIAPALGTHRELARAYLELLRGRPTSALETYERVLDAPRKYPVTNWQPEAAHRAQALNALGRHAEARDVCLAVVSQTSDEDLRMRFLYQPAQQELALSEALLGQIAEAEARLDRLIAEVGALDNPLLSGCLHRDRGRVALLANDGAAFALHLAHTAACFQRTQNPCLIQQYGVLAAQGARAGFRDARMEAPSDSGRAHSRRPLGADARFGVVERRSAPPDSAITQLERPGSPDTLTTLVDGE